MQHDTNSNVRPSLLRICVAQDGRLKANFSDNSILVLNTSGSGFVHCLHASSNISSQSTQASPAVAASPPLFNSKTDGSPIVSRQLSEYALSRHIPQLRVALEFRNMHLDQPFFCQPLLRKEPRPQGLSLGFLISELWWPHSAEDALAAGLAQQLPDGRVAVSTADSSARMVLHHHRRRFAVCYPLLVEESPVEGKYHYVWHTQVFSMQDIPARWQSAAELLLAVSDQLQKEEVAQCSDTAAAAVVHHQQLQQQYQQQQGHQGGLLLPLAVDGCSPPPSRCTPLPIATQRGLSATTGTFAPGSWWLEPTLTLFSPDDVILLEWTPSALYQFYPSSCEAEVWVGHDESCLSTFKQGRYFRHFRCAQDSTRVLDQLYAASAMPEFVWARPPLRASPPPHQPQRATSLPTTHTHTPNHDEPSPQSSALFRDGRQQQKTAAHERGAGHDGLSCQSSAEPHDKSCKAVHHAAAGEVHGLSPPASVGKSQGLPQAPSRYPLATLAAHALKLREQMRLVVAAQAVADAAGGPMVGGALRQQDAFVAPGMGVEESFGVMSEKVLEHAEVPGQGTFSAYEDGRVRAMFTDRTIIHLNSAQSHCKVFLPDGASLLVSTDNPVGIEQHMQAVAEFAGWAFKSVEERSHCVLMQARVEAELAAAQRMAKLLGAAVNNRPALSPHLPPNSTPIQGSSIGSSSSSIGARPVQETGRGLAVLRPAPLEDESVPQLNASLGTSGSLFGGAPNQGFDGSAGGQPNQTSPSQARGARADGSRGGDVHSSHQPCSVQEMVEQLLQENAKLLQRLG